jgi:hypothetical protein
MVAPKGNGDQEGGQEEMMRAGQFYGSGEWLVREGSEEDFVER